MSEYENDPYNIRAVDAVPDSTAAYDPYTFSSSEQEVVNKKQHARAEMF